MKVFIVTRAEHRFESEKYMVPDMVFTSVKKAEKAIRKRCPHAKKDAYALIPSYDCCGDDGYLYFIREEEVH